MYAPSIKICYVKLNIFCYFKRANSFSRVPFLVCVMGVMYVHHVHKMMIDNLRIYLLLLMFLNFAIRHEEFFDFYALRYLSATTVVTYLSFG